jgi:hypothetical protein
MSLIIPTSKGLPYYTQRTELDGVEYILRFLFNQRIGRWTVDFYTAQEEPIAHGLPLRSNFPVGRGIVDSRFPPGLLTVIDQVAPSDQESRDPGLYELGERFLFVYFEESELA